MKIRYEFAIDKPEDVRLGSKYTFVFIVKIEKGIGGHNKNGMRS